MTLPSPKPVPRLLRVRRARSGTRLVVAFFTFDNTGTLRGQNKIELAAESLRLRKKLNVVQLFQQT